MNNIINKARRNLFRLATGGVLVALLMVTLPRQTTATKSGGNAFSPETVFSNPASIAINTAASTPTYPIAATPYPAPIAVSGMTGTTTKITVSLYGLNVPRQTQFDVLLVSPTGANLIIASDVGASGLSLSDAYLTLDDSASSNMPQNGLLQSGVFRPTNVGTSDTFPAPAPAGPYNSPAPIGSSSLGSVFNGPDPNGTWNLYLVMDESIGAGSAGQLANGWAITVTTSGSPATTFSNVGAVAYDDLAVPATPYPSTIDVSGLTGVVSNLTVKLNGVSHTRLQDAQILLVSPNGRPFILMAGAGGSGGVTNVDLGFDDAAPNTIPGSPPTGTYKPTQNGNPTFPAPAPPPPFINAFVGLGTAFNGFSPNGTWSLFVIDNAAGNSGSISGGWSLDITTAPYVSPVLGCSAANFAAPDSYPVGTAPTGLASADFDGNNKPDLAVANQNSSNISILLNNGSGGFGSATNFTAGTNPYAIATGKFNADAFEDLVVVNGGSNNISILLGDGLGGFGAPTNYSAGPSPISVVVADFNGDGKQDLAVADFGGFFSGTISVLLGTGTGTFGAATSFGARTQPSFIATGDFNNDGKKDLAVANFGSNNVSILLGTGTGSFTYFSTVLAGSGPVAIAITDDNQDGKLDLAIANYNGNGVTTAQGNGDGTFNSVAGGFGTLSNPISLAYGDVSSDGNPELAVANSGSNNVSLLGPGIFANVTVGGGPYGVVMRDFDGDGRLDLATANNGSNDVTVAFNRCNVADGNRFDFDNDRRTDVGVFRPVNTTWYVRLSGTFNAFTQDVFGGPLDQLVPADYDGDGKTDYATYRPASGIWSVRDLANLNRPLLYAQFGMPTDKPVPADYDGDGRADIAVFRPSTGDWYIRQSTDNSLRSMNFGMVGDLPVPADYDGDGKADLAVFRPSTASWYILQSMTNSVTGVQFGATGDRPVPDDYDGDSKADIAVYRNGEWYMLQSHDGSFRSAFFGMSGDVPVPGDYDRDGLFDVAVFRPSNGTWYLLQSTNGFAAQQWGLGTDTPLPSTDVP